MRLIAVLLSAALVLCLAVIVVLLVTRPSSSSGETFSQCQRTLRLNVPTLTTSQVNYLCAQLTG